MVVVKRKRKIHWKEAITFWLTIAAILAVVAGVISFGIWFEIQRWHVYNYTHHTNIGYWTWQLFVNSKNN